MIQKNLLKENFHTHTSRCHHASGTVIEYVQAAVEKNAHALGFSDHTPLPDNRWAQVRMSLRELPEYVAEIQEAARLYPEIQLFKGLECEFSPHYIPFYQEELLGRYNFDYLIAGAHYFPYKNSWQDVYGGITNKKELHAYTDYLVSAIESKLFLFIAHPDLFANSYLKWDPEAISCSKTILQAASVHQIPLEINGYGFRKPWLKKPARPLYPLKDFWELASQFDITTVINSDAHHPNDVLSNLTDCYQFVLDYKLNVKSILNFLPHKSP